MENSLKNHDESELLKSAPIGKLLLKFSVPCVLSMLVSALYNIVDQIFIGQGVGYLANAATNVVYPFTVFALAISLLIGDGCAAFFSLSLGRGDKENAVKSAGNGIILTLICAVLLTVVGFVFEEGLLRLFGVTEECYKYAKDYMDVILAGIPFYMFTSAMNSLIRADGSPAYSMIATAIGAVLNMILDPIAIFKLGLGVTGAAAATIIGQIVTAVISALYFKKTKLFKLDKTSFKLSVKTVKKVALLGVSSFIIQIAIVTVMTVANNMIVIYGRLSVYGAEIPLAVIGIVMKVFAIVIAFIVGIAVGGQPIIGYNYGAKNYKRVILTLKTVIIANLIIGLIATLIFEFIPQAVVDIFGNEGELYNEYACKCFRIFLAGIMLLGVQKTGSIFLQSIGKSVKSIILSLSRDIIFFVPGLLIFTPVWGVTGMLYIAPICDVLSFILTVVFLYSEYRNMKRQMA